MELSKRIQNLPPYLFEEIDKAKKAALAQKRPVIDLGVGDPDTPTPEFIVRKLNEAVEDSQNHKYPSNKGLFELREVIGKWFEERFDVKMDPEKEIMPFLGSKEGIAHTPLAFVNPGDTVLVPEPGYPPYRSGTILAGGEVSVMPLKAENSFLPDLSAINERAARAAKLMFVNYPNNPTGAVAEVSFYQELVDFAKKYDIIICSDAAYSEISYDSYSPVSFFAAKGAKDVGIEFHSLSKTFNMTGWRSAMAVGNSDLIKGLGKVKSNIDSGMFQAIQIASVEAIRHVEKVRNEMCGIYKRRRDVLVSGLRELGWPVDPPKATFYVWAPVLDGYDSFSLAKQLLKKTNIVATPGGGFGPAGEGYVRMALTKDVEVLKEAVFRIKKNFFK